MVIKLKAIKDPGQTDKDGTQKSVPISPTFPKHMKLRKLVLKQNKNNKNEDIAIKEVSPDPKLSSLEKIGDKDSKIDCQKVCEYALERIESVDNKHICIGKNDKKIFCGPVIHKIPMGGYGRIGAGECITYRGPPLNKDNTFKYERDKQLALKVNNRLGTDYLIVVAANGCVFVDAGASIGINMPVFVVEHTGEYYKLDKGQRIFNLMAGNHVIIYTTESPIVFPRVDHKAKPVIKPALKAKTEDKSKVDSTEKSKKKEEPKKDQSLDAKVKSDDKEKVGSIEKSPKKEGLKKGSTLKTDSKSKSDDKEKVGSIEKSPKKQKSKIDEPNKGLSLKTDSKTKSDDKEKFASLEKSPKKEEPKKDEPKLEEPKKDEPKLEEPKPTDPLLGVTPLSQPLIAKEDSKKDPATKESVQKKASNTGLDKKWEDEWNWDAPKTPSKEKPKTDNLTQEVGKEEPKPFVPKEEPKIEEPAKDVHKVVRKVDSTEDTPLSIGGPIDVKPKYPVGLLPEKPFMYAHSDWEHVRQRQQSRVPSRSSSRGRSPARRGRGRGRGRGRRGRSRRRSSSRSGGSSRRRSRRSRPGSRKRRRRSSRKRPNGGPTQ